MYIHNNWAIHEEVMINLDNVKSIYLFEEGYLRFTYSTSPGDWEDFTFTDTGGDMQQAKEAFDLLQGIPKGQPTSANLKAHRKGSKANEQMDTEWL